MSLKTETSIVTALQSKQVIRGCVASAAVRQIGPTWLELETQAPRKLHNALSSGDSAMLDQQELARLGEPITGTVRLDVVGDDILRIRYAEAATVPENRTEMVCGTPPAPVQCVISRTRGLVDVGAKADGKTLVDQVVVATAAVTVTVSLDPFRITVADRHGQLLGVGGPEKNYFACFDSYNTGLSRAGGDRRAIASESFDLRPGEAIYGLGEQFIGLDKRGQTIELNMMDALGVTSPRSYKNIPFYVSTHGYGAFFNHSSIMNFWVGSLSAVDLQVGIEDDFLDYYLFFGDLRHILHLYTGLTGRGCVPPAWTFGYWQSKISYQAAAEVLEIARQLRAHAVPCDVIHLDTFWFDRDWFCDLKFAADRFPDPAGFLRELADLGFKVSLWQIPYIPEGSELFDELLAVDGFVKTATGELHPNGFCFTKGFKGRVGIIDYSNPAAVRVHQRHFRRLFELGVKVIKTDFGEAAPVDGVYHNRLPGRQNHNLYPLLYNRAVAAVTQECTGAGVVWARSAWAGCQRYPLHWGGDNSPNLFNLLPQLEGGLSFGLSGFQFWSQDIGGFIGTTNDALLIRWMQLGMFLSHSRIHGFGDRELYKFAPETMRICRDYIQLRYRLMPYILAQAKRCVDQSLPMARALVVDFQDDPNVHHLSDQYLFGDDLLVAPMLTASTRRRVYLPAGVWTDFRTGERTAGPRWLEVEAGLEILPLYLREGALIPLGPVMNYVDEKPLDQLELLVSLLTTDGVRELAVPVDGGQMHVRYVAAGGRHRLTTSGATVPLQLKTFGDGELVLEPNQP